MKRETALIKNTLILSLGTYLPKLTMIVTLPLLTGYLTKAEFGTYDLINTLVSLLLPAATLQIGSAAFRFLISCRHSDEDISKIVTNIIAFTLPVSLLTLTITYFTLNGLGPLTRLLVTGYFFWDIVYIVFGQTARGLGKNFIYAIGSVMVSVITMLGICASLLLTKSGLDGILAGMIVSYVAGAIFLSVRIRLHRYIRLSLISAREIGRLLKYSWPMVPNALSSWVLSLSDRLVITSFIGIEANAVYAVANKIPNLVKTFQGTFTSAWQENASISVGDHDKDSYYGRMFDAVNGILMGMTAVLIASTPILFRLLIQGQYDDAYQQMPFLYLGVLFSCLSSFLGGIYIAYMKTKSVGLTTLCAAAINLAIDLVLIKHIGIYAGSISTMVSYVLLFAFRMYDMRKFQKVEIKMTRFLVSLFALVVMCGLCAFRDTWANVLNGAIGLTLAFAVNRDLILSVLRYLFRRMASSKRAKNK